ncbi:monovalent cation/H(+) antiporter subunit G [Thermotoga sp.]|uniref:monovalent cation/H(+) antiporter subunit G n=1 Tax=Thermotoga sp. TaxID=28240 RepID=UPI0025F9C3AD|nr:monovalent cation/H(+) antiporter subunit G [Thermotoga sp.]MCD6551533.1 monovalent cation/H(+) antiporter subunit G [Thermotoga sp.]
MIYVGVVLMCLGTFLTLIKKDFYLKMHFIGISDTVGSIFVVLNFWEDASRTVLMIVILLVWGPFISHVIARMYTEGSS